MTKPVPFPRGVADPAGTAAYITNAEGGVDAIDLQTGSVLWSSAAATRPLIASGGRLAALASESPSSGARVVILDGGRGRTMLMTDPLELPDWALAPGTDRSIRAEMDGETLRLVWEAHARYRGGANPPSHVLQRETRDAGGVIRIDLRTGRVETAPPDTETEQGDDETQAAVPGLEPTAQEVHVIGSCTYYIAATSGSESLKARDLASGTVIWERPLGTRRVARPPALRR